jgi:amino acid permease
LAEDVVSVYIGVAFFAVLYIGYSIYGQIQGQRHFVPPLEADFEKGAVWSRGGGQMMREAEAAEKEAQIAAGLRVKWFSWQRIKESVY